MQMAEFEDSKTDSLTPEVEEVPVGDSNQEDFSARSCNFFQIRNRFEMMNVRPAVKRTRKQVKPPLSLPQSISSSPSASVTLYPQFKSNFTKRQFSSLEAAFATADSNQDGYLEAKDIKKLLDEHEQSVNLCEVDFMVMVGDENQDGKLSFKEFLQLCIPASEELNSERGERMNEPLPSEDFMKEILKGVCCRVRPVGNKNVKDSLEYFEKKMTGEDKCEEIQSDSKKKLWQVDIFEGSK